MHMSALMGKLLKGLQSSAPMFYARGKYYINNSNDDFRVIGKEKVGLWQDVRKVYKPF